MSELIVFAFPTETGASEMDETIHQLKKEELMVLKDAAVVTGKFVFSFKQTMIFLCQWRFLATMNLTKQKLESVNKYIGVEEYGNS